LGGAVERDAPVSQLLELRLGPYRVLIEEGRGQELTRLIVSRSDARDVTAEDIEKIRKILTEKLNQKKYRLLGFRTDLFDETLTVYVNFTKEERLQQGPYVPGQRITVPAERIKSDLIAG